MNVVIGLCVGYDSLFYKYFNVYIIILVIKDCVIGYNFVVVLYIVNFYYCKKLMLEGE